MLLRKIIEDPHDDAPRLVYADYLDEHGQSERAEFIRVQCELVGVRAAIDEADKQDDDIWTKRPLYRRRAELAAREKELWLAGHAYRAALIFWFCNAVSVSECRGKPVTDDGVQGLHVITLPVNIRTNAEMVEKIKARFRDVVGDRYPVLVRGNGVCTYSPAGRKLPTGEPQ